MVLVNIFLTSPLGRGGMFRGGSEAWVHTHRMLKESCQSDGHLKPFVILSSLVAGHEVTQME